jgi:SM-20-related protein
MDVLSEHHYVVIDDFLDDGLYGKLREFFNQKLSAFEQAGIGAANQNLIKRNIRGDRTYWLDRGRDDDLQDFWLLLDEAKQVLNRYCYLSLTGEEFHLAHYPSGGHYARHLDQFEGRNNRMISMVIYLNHNWQPHHGGQLEILDGNREIHLVEPMAKRCVLFKSAEVPHAVLESFTDRYSITGWLLYQPPGIAALLT